MAEPVPMTWSEVLRSYGPRVPAYVEGMQELLDEELPETQPDSRPVDLGGGASLLAFIATLGDPAQAADWLPRLAPYYEEALRTIARPRRTPTGTACTIRFRHVASCLAPLAASLPDPERDYLKWLVGTKDHLDERHRHGLAFSAAHSGQLDLIPQFLGGTPLPAQPKPGEKFGMAVAPFIRYMAAAKRSGLSEADVLPAWHAFLVGFPFQLAADILEFEHLMHGARAVHADVGRAQTETVAAWLHDEVSRAAGAR